MRVAIAGASGLVGHGVASRLLAEGHTVVRIGRGPAPGIAFDLAKDHALAAGALAGCEALVHAAGVTDEDFADRDAAWTKAIRGTAALLAAAKSAGLTRLVYVSSAHVYGPLAGRLDEASPVNPLSDYAIAHFAAEQLVRRAAIETGARALLLRPCAVYGQPERLERFARWSLIPFDFPRQALSGRIVLKSPGLQARNFVAAEALGAFAAAWLASGGPEVEIANAPGPVSATVYDFAALCARIALEETGQAVAIDRPAPSGPPTAALEYRTRSGEAPAGPSLEDHVRGLVRALLPKAAS
jgi:UDP-glucose 4-epimerase